MLSVVWPQYHVTTEMSGTLMELVGVSGHALLNSGPEKGLYRSAKVKGQHSRAQGAHTSSISSCGGIFLLFLVRLGIETISKPWEQLIVEIHAMRCGIALRNYEPSQLKVPKKNGFVNDRYRQAHM
jgi:hypothetical protein